jgi:hypothetical protein
MRKVSGRLTSDFSYSPAVYNNLPWPALQPQGLSPHNIPAEAGYSYVKPNIHEPLEAFAQAVLDARAAHPNSSLADLYGLLTMPANLLKAHQALDKAVDAT